MAFEDSLDGADDLLAGHRVDRLSQSTIDHVGSSL